MAFLVLIDSRRYQMLMSVFLLVYATRGTANCAAFSILMGIRTVYQLVNDIRACVRTYMTKTKMSSKL